MSLFKRIKNIINSNVNYGKEIEIDEIDINKYDDVLYNDTKVTTSRNNQEEMYYKTLELEYGADFNQIKKAYRSLAKKYHEQKRLQAAVDAGKNVDELKADIQKFLDENEKMFTGRLGGV